MARELTPRCVGSRFALFAHFYHQIEPKRELIMIVMNLAWRDLGRRSPVPQDFYDLAEIRALRPQTILRPDYL